MTFSLAYKSIYSTVSNFKDGLAGKFVDFLFGLRAP
jgi:hypothetical protein